MSSLHERAGQVLLAALARPAAERDAFLVTTCGEDEALLAEVASLLLFHEDGGEDADATSDAAGFAAGDVFAGRYRMIARAGRGGMGDVWRADDLVLQTTVALKLVHGASAAARARIVDEVRLARQITHPAVCRVFDVGEAGDVIFYSMEFVSGEDLAALLKRTGRLTPERVLDIAHQLCAGLAAAHAQGVLHRDLKPANILIDQSGSVRITDFGIAVVTDEARSHGMFGTIGYMAPEQLAGEPLTERGDLYGLGVVLYELVTGLRHQVARPGSASAPLSVLAPGIAPGLERAILAATSPNPGDRPASALAMAAALPVAGAAPARAGRWRQARWLAGTAVMALAVIAAPLLWSRAAGGTLTAHDTIILADFQNTTGDPVFDNALKVALAVALEQSPFLKVFPDERAHEALRLMQRLPSDRIDRATAREIARREQLRAFVAGEIASLGRHYVVGLEAVNVETGEVMAREQVEVNSKEEVLSALGAAASRLRRRLGESLTSIERYDVPLPRATTPSLDALQAYALALDGGRINPRVEAIPHLQRAIQLDPNFALAQALLSGVYVNTGQPALAPEWSRRAFDHRDRVTERERYFISWRYYRDAVQAWDKGRELARAWTVAYPREAFAFNSLGLATWGLGHYQQAVAPLRESLRLDPKFIPPWSNLSATLTALNQFDEAKALQADARAAGIEHIALRREAYVLAFIGHDADGMAHELHAALATPEGPQATGWEPRIAAFGGQIEQAHDGFRRGMAATSQAGLAQLAGLYSAYDAIAHALVGQCRQTRADAAAAMALSRDNFTLGSAARALAWCGADRDAADIADELTRRFPEAVLTTRLIVPVIAAARAIRSGAPARGLELLEAVRPLERSPEAEFWPEYLRGEAQLQLKRNEEAAGEFRHVIEHRGELADSPLYPLAHLGLGRALAGSGDHTGARQAYSSFLTMWKDADPGLTPLSDARREIARLPQ